MHPRVVHRTSPRRTNLLTTIGVFWYTEDNTGKTELSALVIVFPAAVFEISLSAHLGETRPLAGCGSQWLGRRVAGHGSEALAPYTVRVKGALERLPLNSAIELTSVPTVVLPKVVSSQTPALVDCAVAPTGSETKKSRERFWRLRRRKPPKESFRSSPAP
jgi:hypothetical protein